MRLATATLLGAALLCSATAAVADEIGVAARRMVILDRVAVSGKAKVVFVAKDTGVIKGSGTDPADIEATVEIRYNNGTTAGTFTMPPGAATGPAPGWKLNSARVAKFVNGTAPLGPTGTKAAVIVPGKTLKLVGKSLGDPPIDIVGAGDPGGSGVTVVYTVRNGTETIRHCAAFTAAAGSIITYKAADGGANLTLKNGTAVACPALPLDHYTVYSVATSGGGGPPVAVTDLFASGISSLGVIGDAFSPAAVDGQPLVDPLSHALCYSTGSSTFGAAVTVSNRFGSYAYQLGAATDVCVASELNPGPTPAVLGLDHYRCYRVLGPAHVPFGLVSAIDSFKPVTALVVHDPRWFCTPAGIGGAALKNPNGHLMCYETNPFTGSGVGAFFPFRNQFGVVSKYIAVREALCVPSVLITADTSCPHDHCTQGGPLAPSCHPCVADVCAIDPGCCGTRGWDADCVNLVRNTCGEPCPATCDVCADPGRGEFAGDFSFTSGCQTFTDETSCEQAWQCDSYSGPASCYWNGTTCQGCNAFAEEAGGCDNTCHEGAAECAGDASRTLFAGWPNTAGCARFDGDQPSCEAAFAFLDAGYYTTCRWDGMSATCLPCQGFEHNNGTCTNTCPVCPQDASRTTFRAPSHAGDDRPDQGSCEAAFHFSPEGGYVASCFWNGGNCRGCGPNNQANGNCSNTCLAHPCDTAIDIPASGGSFTGATFGGGFLIGPSSENRDAPAIVYRWTPGVSGRAVIGTCGGTTDYDSFLYVREGNCSSLAAPVVEDYDSCRTATAPSDELGSVVAPVVTAGQTYYVVVTGTDRSAGHYTLTVRPPEP